MLTMIRQKFEIVQQRNLNIRNRREYIMLADIIIVAILAMCLAGIGVSYYKRKKSGKGGCGCGCDHCSMPCGARKEK